MLRRLIKSVFEKRGYLIVPFEQSTVIWEHDVEATRRIMRDMRPVSTDRELRRFGGESDGAYLIPDDLEGVQAVFSPGVAEVATFEEQMAARGIECYLADASVEAPPVKSSRIHFLRKYVGSRDCEKYIRLDTWVDQCAPGESDLILQMDIEGAEWEALMSIPTELLMRFRIVVIEFHDTIRLLDCPLRRSAMERLLVTHDVVHLHVNNAGDIQDKFGLQFPKFLEVTYLRKGRANLQGLSRTIPHPLDVINVPGRSPLDVPDCWLR